MNKAELIEAVAKDAEISRSKAADAVDAFIDSVSKSLKKGQKVTLVGFGTFGTSKRKAREGRNPQTGAKIKIPARRVARFKPGKALIAAVR
jgi:DNA-binding protein HU-beta